MGYSSNALCDLCNKSIGASIGFTLGFVYATRKNLVKLYSIAF